MCGNGSINGITKNGGCKWLVPPASCDQKASSSTEGRKADSTDAEYCILNAEAGVRIPSHVSAAEYAPILCAGVTVFSSMRQMGIKPGSTVAIQGLGGLGHLAIQYANRFGFRVVAISRDDQKERFVRDLGAHEYIDTIKEDVGTALQEPGGAALIVATAANAGAILCC
jgi:D-arabinose 1-dehydrogenase-like Zn-dependent alcohol dehydrogenase